MNILEEVLKQIPDKSKISDSGFEGANIILYTKDKNFLFSSSETIKKIVDSIKKRVELRPDPAITMDMEEAKKEIEKILPKEAGITNIIFDSQRSIVIIEAEKPGLVIGKGGELLKEIKEKVLWVPLIRRTPAIRSTLIENIRRVLYENSAYRRKFLNKIGERVYGGWTKEKRHEWIRVSFLGGGRQVGRSCLFLQTPESRILLDCGINVAAEGANMYPMLDAPEFKIENLDAIICTHAHLDHCLHPESFIQLGDGTITKIGDFYNQKRDDIKCLDIDDSLKIEEWRCFEKVKIPAPNKLYKIKTRSNEIIVTGEHPFFLLDNNLKLINKKAKELQKGDFIATAKKITSKGKKQNLSDIVKVIDISETGRSIMRNERKRRGLRQIDVAKKVGCVQVTISSIEIGKKACSLDLFKKLVEFYGFDKKFIRRYCGNKRNKSTKIKFPKKTSKELLQILGYLIGDGCRVDVIVKGKRCVRVEVTDKNVSNLENYKKLIKNVFDLNGKIIIKERNRLVFYSHLLLDFINSINNKILCKSPYREIPELVHKATKEEISGFLKGLYDAEGSVGDHHIILSSTSRNIIQITQMLLLRYGIKSYIYNSKSPKSNRTVYQLSIYDSDSIRSFKKKINFDDLNKQTRLYKLTKKVGNACAERIDLIPFRDNKLLEIAKKLRLRKTDLRKLGINYYHYSKHNISRKKLKQISYIFNNRAKELCIESNELKDISKLINSDILWDPIQNIQEIKSDCDFVYDMKVAGHHNYIANGIIVHNCGFIPWLYKMSYRGPLYCTAPTRDVAALLALDFIGVSQKEAKNALFSSTDVKEMVKHTVCLDYGEVTDITPDVRITLYNSGHTLGSSLVHMHIGNGLHNFVYSLDWKTSVTVIDAKDNVFFKPIGEIIDKNFDEFPDLVTKSGVVEELPNLEGLNTIVFNPKTYKTEIKPITSFIRHPIIEDLCEIKTASGRKVTVTKSHSVFSVKDGDLIAVKVENLNKGDFILGPKKIPVLNREPEINLLEHIPKLRIKIEDTKLLDWMLTEYKIKLDQLKETDREMALEWVMEHYKFASYKYEIAKKYKVHPRRIRRVFNILGIKDHPRVKHIFPAVFKINKDFARFLGYFVAEGWARTNSQTIEISNTNYKILEDCYKIIKDTFGIIGDIRYEDGVVLFNSKQLKYLISNVLKCGKNAYTKRVPSQILLSSQEIVSNFLYGYFSGDGGIINKKNDKGRSVYASSKNFDLIQDVTFLLLQFGLVPTITYNEFTRMHTASIYNSAKIKEFLDKIGIENEHLISLIPKLIRKKLKGSFDMRIPLLSLDKKGQLFLSRTSWQNSKSCNRLHLKKMELSDLNKKIIKSDFVFDQIRYIKKVKPTNKYVYDLKVDGYENFTGGDGFLFLHNTGDMKYLRTQLLEPANVRFPRLETLCIESTYGSREDILPSRKVCEDELIDFIKKVLGRGGKVLIPVLGVGRSQEVMLILESAMREGRLEKQPVYLQGLVWDVTAIHTAYPDFLNRIVRKNIFHRDANPFLSDVFKQIGSKKEQDEVLEEKGPCIIMATSGMLTGGASVEIFKRLADNKRNGLLFTCYQGEGSLGRRIQTGEKEIIMQKMEGMETTKVDMEVKTISGLTGHAGRNELLRYIYNLSPRPKKIIVNHGESSKCLELASTIHKSYRVETSTPRNLEAVRLR